MTISLQDWQRSRASAGFILGYSSYQGSLYVGPPPKSLWRCKHQHRSYVTAKACAERKRERQITREVNGA